jgi:hypothetical protein
MFCKLLKWDFLSEKTDFYVCQTLLSRAFFPFNLENFPFQVCNIFVFPGDYDFFNYFDEFLRVAPEKKFGIF